MMKFLALALDYDGTIAHHDVLDSSVRDAIAELRAQNIVVLIVTGRIMADLRRVAGDMHFVDAVVAENGAVVEFTDSGYSRVFSPPPPPAFLAALQKEGIPFTAGQAIVESDANQAPFILALLQKLELPLALLFNRGRVMVLPQAISKATGLREALKILRLSPHNAVAIGDGENDHELLQSCEIGVAVEWGSEFLKQSADYVLSGQGPSSVTGYIRTLGKSSRIPIPVKAHRTLMLGHTDDGKPMSLAVRGQNVLIAGDTKSGKSWVAGLLCEQMILYGYSLLILDPEGDYTSLEALPGVTVYGGQDPLPRPRELLRSLRHADVSIVIDLSHTPYDEKLEYVRTLLPGLATLRRRTGLPHRIVVDEAHYFLREQGDNALLDLEIGSYTLVTYRASQLHRDILATAEVIIATRESDPREVVALRELCCPTDSGMDHAGWTHLLDSLVLGEAVALPRTVETGGELRRVRLAPRLTPHIRHAAKYVDIPVSGKDEFVFWRGNHPSGERARSLRQFVSVVEQRSMTDLDGHLQRGDFSTWIANVFGDYVLADVVRGIEGDYRSGESLDVIPKLKDAIRSRYDFVNPLSDSHG
jgi:hydroxymethylpyrimidine pyrophosphatase-like HAD family hydrolase